MIRTRFRATRLGFLAALAVLAMALAPAAFARGHVSIGLYGPGYSVGYSDCRHCGGRGWYPGGPYGNGYYGYAPYRTSYRHSAPYPYYGYSGYTSYPSYYYGGPVYRDDYRPVVTRRVVHREVRYYDRDDRRPVRYSRDTYRNDRDYGRDRDRGYSRASYYRD